MDENEVDEHYRTLRSAWGKIDHAIDLMRKHYYGLATCVDYDAAPEDFGGSPVSDLADGLQNIKEGLPELLEEYVALFNAVKRDQVGDSGLSMERFAEKTMEEAVRALQEDGERLLPTACLNYDLGSSEGVWEEHGEEIFDRFLDNFEPIVREVVEFSDRTYEAASAVYKKALAEELDEPTRLFYKDN